MNAIVMEESRLAGILTRKGWAADRHLGRRLHSAGEMLAAMVLADEFSEPLRYVSAEMQRLSDALLADAIEASDLIAEKRPSTWPTAIGMGLGAGSLVMAGAEMIAVGNMALGIASMIAGAAVAVWASLVRG